MKKIIFWLGVTGLVYLSINLFAFAGSLVEIGNAMKPSFVSSQIESIE